MATTNKNGKKRRKKHKQTNKQTNKPSASTQSHTYVLADSCQSIRIHTETAVLALLLLRVNRCSTKHIRWAKRTNTSENTFYSTRTHTHILSCISTSVQLCLPSVSSYSICLLFLITYVLSAFNSYNFFSLVFACFQMNPNQSCLILWKN